MSLGTGRVTDPYPHTICAGGTTVKVGRLKAKMSEISPGKLRQMVHFAQKWGG